MTSLVLQVSILRKLTVTAYDEKDGERLLATIVVKSITKTLFLSFVILSIIVKQIMRKL